MEIAIQAGRLFRWVSDNAVASAVVALAGGTLVKLAHREAVRLTQLNDWPLWALLVGLVLLGYFGWRATVVAWGLRGGPGDIERNAIGLVVARLEGDDGTLRDRLIARLAEAGGNAIRIIAPEDAPPFKPALLAGLGGDVMLGGSLRDGWLHLSTAIDLRRWRTPDAAFEADAAITVPLAELDAMLPVVLARVLHLGAPGIVSMRRFVTPAMRRLLLRLLADDVPAERKALCGWAAASLCLGLARRHLGKTFDQGVAACDAALERCDRTADPVMWGELCLVRALIHQSRTYIGDYPSELDAAIASAKNAAQAFGDGGKPLRRAAANYMLAETLLIHAAVGSPDIGAADAEAVHRQVLDDVDGERHPILRSILLNSHADALLVCNEKDSNVAHLRRALDAYDEGLALLEQMQPPSTSSAMIGNQAATLYRIAVQTNDPVLARRAAARFEDALELDDPVTESKLAEAHRHGVRAALMFADGPNGH